MIKKIEFLMKDIKNKRAKISYIDWWCNKQPWGKHLSSIENYEYARMQFDKSVNWMKSGLMNQH